MTRSPPPRNGWRRCSPPAPRRRGPGSLFVSFHTIDTQLRSIYHKLGIHNRMQLERAWDRDDR